MSRCLSSRRALRWILAAAVALSPVFAHAQAGPPGLSETDKQQIKNYNLSEDVLNRLVETTREARTIGIQPQAAPDPSKIHTIDDLANQAMAADARIEPLIRKHGFAPREFMLANIALMNAMIVVQSRNDPNMAKAIDQSKINMANVVFVEGHQAQIAALLQGK